MKGLSITLRLLQLTLKPLPFHQTLVRQPGHISTPSPHPSRGISAPPPQLTLERENRHFNNCRHPPELLPLGYSLLSILASAATFVQLWALCLPVFTKGWTDTKLKPVIAFGLHNEQFCISKVICITHYMWSRVVMQAAPPQYLEQWVDVQLDE